ncbi:MAG: creatininase family protein, partial [Candidatus Bathyarchaeota archaeon]|nr:creatininase family protein [Candidatus Bathyarchaeota archaeon]
MSERRLDRLTGFGFRSGGFDKAVLAVGSTESHGDHLPHGTDTIVAQHLADEVAKRVERLLVLPPLPFGMSLHYSSFPIAITLTTETLIGVLKEVLGSLLKHGIMKLL